MNIKYIMKKNKNSGFTLLELLIVIAIIAILSVALVLVLNPAETLKKARDAQRISDLSTLKTAIGLYMTTVSPAYLGGAASNAICKTLPSTSWGASTFKISYSVTGAGGITDATIDTNGTGANGASTRQLAASANTLTDGTGWIPVNFSAIPGGSPISNLPIDPTNSLTTGGSTLAAVSSGALAYRYACAVTPLTYEIDAILESDAYTGVVAGTEDKRLTDGGNADYYYETGTNVLIMGMGASTTVDY
jgi:prepilin-type N-terminal cleavage/methylation domain-containing protein